MSSSENQAVVIDNGSGTIKAGFAGEAKPRTVFPSCIGQPKHLGLHDNTYIGDEAMSNRGIITREYPIERGIVTDWEAMEKIWKYAFYNKLGISPEERPVLLTDDPLNLAACREKTTQIMFETFHTPALYFTNHAILSLYASGRTTGVILDCGEGVCQIVPVHSGFSVVPAILRLNCGGRDLTRYMAKILTVRDINFNFSTDYNTLNDMKEKLSYVALDYDKEMQTAQSSSISKDYKLPDGQVITISSERFRCAEGMFQPSFLGLKGIGIHKSVHNAILECDTDTCMNLYSNIVLSGGSTMFPGFVERMTKELRALTPSNTNINIIASSDRTYSSWIGGSMLASLSTFESIWISQEEYNEFGPSIVHHHCF